MSLWQVCLFVGLLMFGLLHRQDMVTSKVVTAAGSVCSANCTVKAKQAFTFAADHDGVNTAGYKLYSNDGSGEVTIGDLPVSALQGGTVSFAFPTGLAKGKYKLTAAAYNDVKSESRAAPLSLSVTGSGR